MAREMMRPRRRSARAFTSGSLGISPEPGVRWTAGASTLLPRARNSAHRVYAAVTLFAGYVFFNEVGLLQPHELDRKSVVDVTHDAALRLSDGDHDANWRSQITGDADRSAGLREIDHAAGDIGAIGQHEARHWVPRRKPAVTAVLWKVEDLPVG